MASHNKVEIKIEKLCRTCLLKDIQLNSLFDVTVGTVTLDYVVTSITGLKIRKGDGLPSTICNECKDKAEKAYDFKKKSQEALISLRGLCKKEAKLMQKPEDVKVVIKETKVLDVKMEHSLYFNDNNDDFSDTDFNFPLSNNPDESSKTELNVKQEPLKQENSLVLECEKCCLVFDTATKFHEHKKKCGFKVEFEYVKGTHCPICSTRYDAEHTLSKHMWEYHPELMGTKKKGRPKKLMTTTILNKLSGNGLMIAAMQRKAFKCSFCKKQCKTKEDLGVHLFKHKDTKVLCCILCKKMFLKKKYFNSHYCPDKSLSSLTVNESPNTQGDKKLKLAYATQIELQELIGPTGEMTLSMIQVCTACSTVFLSEADLINHHDTIHPELSLRCNHCTKLFASLRTAARHRAVCKEVERMHKCTTCGLKFAYEISLNKHILRYHQGESVSVAFMRRKQKANENMQYQCDTCHKIFHRKEALAKHAKLHMPNQKQYECDICQKKFNRSDNLRTHKKIHDVDRVKPQANNCLCLYCGRGFSNSSNLIVHMRRHTGEKPYKCDFCAKGFPRSSDLLVHRRSHTGEKPCVCRICGKAFSRSNKLSRHMRVHTGQRPYKCTYCEKAFSQSNDLTLHVRRHTGDKPYVCEVCGERFIQGTGLQNHRRAHGHFPPQPPNLTDQVQTALSNQVQATLSNQVQATLSNQVQATLSNQVQATLSNQIQATLSNQVQATLSNQVQAITYTVSNLSNINLQLETIMPN